MATINYYLDKPDKKGLSPIHLRINCSGDQVKISTGEKVPEGKFSKEKQLMTGKSKKSVTLNNYLTYLKERVERLLEDSRKKAYSNKELKSHISELIDAYKSDSKVRLVKEQVPLYGKEFTFIDLFAGAGGISEGFLQAQHNNKFFNFLLGSDINDNCELTHIVRYNHQLNLDAEFLCQDITEPDFLSNLMSKVNGRKIDVVCGGPPCQSFSLAGKRKKFDKKDDLFGHYLNVIKNLQPKYFVMENVKGILTKEKGRIKDQILDEIRSIVDIKEIPRLEKFIKSLKGDVKASEFLIDCIINRIDFERHNERALEDAKSKYIQRLERKFRLLIPRLVDYKTSKTDKRIATIRHGFNLLLRNHELGILKRDVMKERDFSNVDNDYFVNSFNDFIASIEDSSIIQNIESAFNELKVATQFEGECQDILTALEIYTLPFESCMTSLQNICSKKQNLELATLLTEIRLYRIEAPFVANASNYGVPQNRERVLFIGCRKDQPLITDIPPTVTEKEKVTVFEALYDLDFIGNNEEAIKYESVDIAKQYNGAAKKMKSLIRRRSVEGKNGKLAEKTYAEWSKQGRLPNRFNISPPFYVKNEESLENGAKIFDSLHNHKTSKQNKDVVKRLQIILDAGDYKDAKQQLSECGLTSQKRNYNVLKPESQSPTVMTIPDDYVHYNSPRALTVREMARLQSFDDSFVFQGKRSTGGNKRKSEVPQFTLVGNAVPPLLARAVAMEILKSIT